MRTSRRSRPVPRRRAWWAACLAAVVLAGVVGCGDGDVPAAAGPPEPVGFAVVGDSITAGLDAPVEGTRVRGTGSWVPAADVAPLEFRGGWAVPGARTADMRAGVRPVEADVLVVLAGTNDVLGGVPWERTREDLLAAVAATGVTRVVLLAVPPIDVAPRAREDLNAHLAALAGERGWTSVDPWTDVATDRGTFTAGASADGVHPTQPVADLVGTRVRTALLDPAGD
ncbi:SGNH/GDSL hydrolase family protein [Geodermatophilus sp. SYSU D00814]